MSDIDHEQEEKIEIIEIPNKYLTVPSKRPEKVQNYNKNYYENNKQSILEKAKQKDHCEACNCTYQHVNKKKHEATVKHQLNLKIKNLEK
ncbi:MAG: hypothetical protein JSS98_06155 [Bacteroidetes bacterium]|nr:hypothetical protein [Bacteroidota bacterium]